MQATKHTNKEIHLGFDPEETSPELQNSCISGPTKRTFVLLSIFKKVVNVVLFI